MTVTFATPINGRLLSDILRTEIKHRAITLTQKGHPPGLAVILVGNDPASAIYVRNKIKACESSGIRSYCDQYPENLSQSTLLQHIDQLNHDPKIHGILVQLPLPAHIDSHQIIQAISPDKDVDGLHMLNAGALFLGKPRFKPCTPYGVMQMLKATGVSLTGIHAVVIGRSHSVGKPMAILLLEAGATVTVCHRRTQDLAVHTRNADLIVAAAGQPKLLTADMVKKGAVVIDVGIHRLPNGTLCGDVDFESVKTVAGFLSPVPGGVGPMTISMLLVNTIEAAEHAAHLVSIQ